MNDCLWNKKGLHAGKPQRAYQEVSLTIITYSQESVHWIVAIFLSCVTDTVIVQVWYWIDTRNQSKFSIFVILLDSVEAFLLPKLTFATLKTNWGLALSGKANVLHVETARFNHGGFKPGLRKIPLWNPEKPLLDGVDSIELERQIGLT